MYNHARQVVMQNTVHYNSNDHDARQNMRYNCEHKHIPPASTRLNRFVGVRGGGSPPVEARRILLRSRSTLQLERKMQLSATSLIWVALPYQVANLEEGKPQIRYPNMVGTPGN